MSRLHSRLAAAALAAVAVLAAACGGDGGTGPNGEFTVTVTPDLPTLFSVAPANTTSLSVTLRDQDGQTLGGGTRTFASGNTAVATVGDNGVVTAVAPGTAVITATVTLDGATNSGTTTITVSEAAAEAAVRAPGFVFTPGTADISKGGTVTWEIANVPHSVVFESGGSPADVPPTTNASVSRDFPTSGTYRYHCSIHAQMAGVVRVH